jgi:hypothetical protein
MIYQVAVKMNQTIVHVDTIDTASSANEAAELGRKYSQLPYNRVEVYDLAELDANDNAAPIFSKTATR